jgi:signal transduction histidine kinase
MIYRILQEAMNNIAKHGEAGCVQLALIKTGNAIELTIEDNGKGFDAEEVLSRERAHRGAGLASMRERAESSGGSFAIQSMIGIGTRIQAAWRSCNPKTGICNMQ